MTSRNLTSPEGLWPLPPNYCTSPRPGWVRTRRRDGSWGLTCVGNTKNGQNGLRVTRMCDDLYAEVPGQLEIDDVTAASAEDVAAAEFADRLVQAILACSRPTGIGFSASGVPFRTAFVPPQGLHGMSVPVVEKLVNSDRTGV